MTWPGPATPLAFCLALAAGSAGAAGLGSPLIATYTADDIGTDPMGWVAVQDARGVLHFGCNGLVSFDGDRWSSSPIGDTYALRGLDLAPDGRLWAAAVNEIGWFQPAGAGSWAFHSLREKLPEGERDLGEVWNAFAVAGGAVFVSHDRVIWWDGRAMTVRRLANGRRLSGMRAGGAVYVHHTPSGLFRVDRGRMELMIGRAALGSAVVLWMEPRGGDGWLLVTSAGLLEWRNGKARPIAPEASERIRSGVPTGAVRLRDGRLAVGTFKAGILLLDGESGRVGLRLGMGAGLPTDEIYSMAPDREGGLWITTASSIIRADLASAAVLLDRAGGLPEGPYLSFASSASGPVAATDSQIFSLEPGAGPDRMVGRAGGHIWAMQSSPDGVLVARNSGLDLVGPGQAREIYRAEEDVFALAPVRGSSREVWVSNGRRLLRLDVRTGKGRILADNLPDIVTSIGEDAGHRLWCGTTNAGVLAVPGLPAGTVGRALPAGPEAGLPEKIGPVTVGDVGDGTVVAFSPRGGWFLGPSGGGFRPIAGFPRRRIGAVAVTGTGDTAWLVHPAEGGRAACLAAVRTGGGTATWVPYAVDGLWRIGNPAGMLAEKSGAGWRVWVGGTIGILRLELPAQPPDEMPIAPLITVLARGPDSLRDAEVLSSVPYPMRDIRIEFAIPSYAHRPALRLETLLEGIDRDWIPLGPPLVREFPALGDGRYRILARVVDAAGHPGPAASASLVILPPFWRSLPFGLAAGLAGLAAAFGLLQWRVRSLRSRTRDLERMVELRTEEIARANRAKTDFVADISHDIRNPLNGLVGMTVALEDTRLSSRQKQMVRVMRGCGDQLAALVDNVIDFAKVEAGQIELHPSGFDVRDALEEVAAILRACAPPGADDLVVEVDPDVPVRLVADSSRLKEILLNYGANAAAHGGGRTEIGARLVAGAGAQVEFWVRDHGRGLPPGDHGAIFTRFGRLGGTRGRVSGGSGIGLFVCRRLAEAMDGTVGVESIPGRGARFYVRLPLAEGPPAEAAEGEGLAPLRVLLVEDTDYNAWAAAAILDRLGLRLAGRARGGREALDLMAAGGYDLVLLDRSLPDMDGIEVAREIRRTEKPGRRVVIVAVTATSTREDRDACIRSGMDGFVGKPLTPEKLRSALLAARQGGQAAEEPAAYGTGGGGPRLALLEEMARGDPAALEQEKDRFVAHLEADAAELSQALAGGERTRIRSIAHRLVATARLVEASGLALAAEDLERAALSPDPGPVARLGERVRTAAAALAAALRPETKGPTEG